MLCLFSFSFLTAFMAYVIFFIKNLAAVPAYVYLTCSMAMGTFLIDFHLSFSVARFTRNVFLTSKVKFITCFAVNSFKMISYIKNIIFITCSAACIAFLIVHNNGTYSFTFRTFCFHLKPP